MKNEQLGKIMKKFSNMGKDQLLIILLVGVLLVVISLPTKESSNKTSKASQISTSDNISYEEYLENKLEENLSKIEGLGKVSVVIKTKNDGEKIVKDNIRSEEKIVEEADSGGGTRKTTEKLSENEVIMEEKDGEKTPYVTSVNYPEIEGVMVIAKGGDNNELKMKVIEAIEALFSIPAHKIRILKME